MIDRCRGPRLFWSAFLLEERLAFRPDRARWRHSVRLEQAAGRWRFVRAT